MNACKRIEALGFTVYNTGGGCEAYRKEISDNQHILITDTNDPGLPEDNATAVYLGIYDNEEDEFLQGRHISIEFVARAVKDIEEGQPW